MTGRGYESWGGRAARGQRGHRVQSRHAPLPRTDGASLLPFGNGRSYGDSCLNEGGVLLDCRGLNQVIAFDPRQGLIRCEAGMLLADILDVIVPAGWFLPATPGTRYVTLGGAIANDVHGKNHHARGAFGRHVTRLELLRSDGSRLVCSAAENPAWFAATVAGMGLTGLITWAEIRLMPVTGAGIDREVIRFGSLADFAALAAESDRDFEYSVAWVDSLGRGGAFGRGLFIRGNHSDEPVAPPPPGRRPRLSVPFRPPVPLLNRATLKAFNALYYRKQGRVRTRSTVPYTPFFYPLDGVGHWNRLYGPRGLHQHQCVLPMPGGMAAVAEMLACTQAAGIGSFLTVLKMFGEAPSPGLMSFPMPGVTLTLDFPDRGERTLALLEALDRIVLQAGGRVAPYKDARMSAESFRAFFPRWRRLEPFIDPAFSSSFWRRVSAGAAEGGRPETRTPMPQGVPA